MTHGDAGAALLAMIEEQVQAKVDARVNELEARVRQLEQSSRARPTAECVRLNEACTSTGRPGLFPFSRATFNRWLADPAEGLEDGPEPVVLRPNGPRGKVLVHVARMQGWLDARAARPKLLRRRA